VREIERRDDAERRLLVLLELPGVRRAVAPEGGGLLRVLQLRQFAVPVSPALARDSHKASGGMSNH
jgi:hypothetical protein